jgi:hypothetical protein
MAEELIFDNPLFRLLVVIIAMIVVVTLVATNAVYFG